MVGKGTQGRDATRFVEVSEREAQRLEHPRLALVREQLEQREHALLPEQAVEVAARAAELAEDLHAECPFAHRVAREQPNRGVEGLASRPVLQLLQRRPVFGIVRCGENCCDQLAVVASRSASISGTRIPLTQLQAA